MAKPSITTRAGKGTALTYTELDTNFTNLQDATLSLRAGSAGTTVSSDLNATITLVAGSNVTLTGDNSAKTITIASSGSGGGFYDNGVVTTSTFSPTVSNGLIQFVLLTGQPTVTISGFSGTPVAGDRVILLVEANNSGIGNGDITLDISAMQLISGRQSEYFEKDYSGILVLPEQSGFLFSRIKLDIIYANGIYWCSVETGYSP
jgi:hypothetical protein